MYRLILRNDELESAFVSLSNQLPASILDNSLHLPPLRGTGVLKGLLLEEGLYLLYSRLRYYKTAEIIRLPKRKEAGQLFGLTFLLTPHSLKPGKHFPKLPSRGFSGNILLTSNISRYSFQIPEGVLCHTIELSFSREWLHANMADTAEKLEAFSRSPDEDGPAPSLQEATTPGEDHLLREIEAELHNPGGNLLTIRARAFLLLAGITHRLPGPPQVASPVRESYYAQTIRQVEQRLVHSLEDMPPSQKELAKEFALSESTLKRYFKATYGKTMYEYYLEKKMARAKWLLQEKKTSVSETAYMLGYEKVSAFINIFKKYHKVLPGSLKFHHLNKRPVKY